jgi:hypothetical protein
MELDVLAETLTASRHAPRDDRPAVWDARAWHGVYLDVNELDPAMDDGDVPEEG